MSPGLRIGVDARPLVYPGTGNARYLDQMLRALLRLRPEHEWVLFSHRPLHESFLDLLQSPQVLLDVSRSAVAARLGPYWVHNSLPGLINSYECDVFWGTIAMLPLRYKNRTQVPAIVNFHDLNALVAPQTMKAWVRWQLLASTRGTLEHAEQVMCLSGTTKHDIERFFPELKGDRLQVVYPGCEMPAGAHSAEAGERPPGLPDTLTVAGCKPESDGIILLVGTVEPRKNQGTVIEAYLKLKPEERGLPLVLFGRRGWGDESLYARLVSGALEQEGVYFVEDAPDAQLAWGYQSAAYLVFPSLHEGFGLPIIEAYQMDRPALVSDIPIFREIAPDAEHVAATDAEAWAAKLRDWTRRSLAGDLHTPPFDSEFWSWEKRAQLPAQLIDGLGAGRGARVS